MKRRFWTFSILPFVFSVFGCANAHPMPEAMWKIELTTSGGFAGRGMGSITIDSENGILAERRGLQVSRAVCRATLSSEDRETVMAFFNQNQDETRQRVKTVPPDAIVYTLTRTWGPSKPSHFSKSGGVLSTPHATWVKIDTWADGEDVNLSHTLSTFRSFLFELWRRTEAACH